jgi:hypothetical protein
VKKAILIWILTFLLLCSFASADYKTNLTSYYKLDVNSSTQNDSVNAYNGNVTDATWIASGQISAAYNFDGTNDYVAIPVAAFNNQQLSWSAWYKLDSTAGQQSIMGHRVTHGNMYTFVANNGGARFLLTNPASSKTLDLQLTSDNTFHPDTTTWHHLVVTADTQNGIMNVYLDGVNKTSIMTDASIGGAFTPAYNTAMSIGGNLNAGTLEQDFNGDIDEVATWDKVLTATDVLDLYNAQKDGFTSGQYPFSSDNFTIRATDAFDASELTALSANVTLANGSSFYYTNSTGGFIDTGIAANATQFANITLNTSNYFTKTILNQNLSVNLITTLNQTATSFAAFDVFGDSVSSGNITINAQTNPLSYVWPLQAGTYNVTFSSADYYSITQEINVSALSTTTQNITGVFDTNFTINAIDFVDNGTINNFNVTIIQSNVSFSAFNTTSNGNLSFGLLKSRLYNVTVRSDGYLINNNSNYNISTNLTAVMRSATSSATFIDSNTSLGIINRSITLIYPDATQLSLTTNENGTVSWVTVLNGVEIYGEYNITFDSQEGYESPQSFLENITALNAPLNTSYNISPATLNITIRDQATGNLINQSTIVTIVGIGQFNVTGGNLAIQNGSIGAGNYTLYALSDGYVIGQTVFDYDAREVENIDIYLIQSNASNTGTVQVTIFDEGFNTQLGADVRLLQYFSSSDSFVQVDQCFSNSNGECFFGVQLGTTLYKVTATKTIVDETLSGVSSNDGEIFYIDDYAIEINMFNDLVYSAPDLLGFSLTAFNKTLINNISYLTGVWSDKYSNSHQVCIRYSYINNTIITPLSGGLNVNVFGGYNLTTILATQSVLVELFVNETTGNEVVYWEEIYTSTKSFETQAGDLAPYVIIILFTTALALSLYLKSVFLFGVGATIVSLASRRFFPTYFNWEIVAVMIILSFLLFYLSRKKEGNVAV